jgi:hypothetical protein
MSQTTEQYVFEFPNPFSFIFLSFNFNNDLVSSQIFRLLYTIPFTFLCKMNVTKVHRRVLRPHRFTRSHRSRTDYQFPDCRRCNRACEVQHQTHDLRGADTITRYARCCRESRDCRQDVSRSRALVRTLPTWIVNNNNYTDNGIKDVFRLTFMRKERLNMVKFKSDDP